MVSRVVEEIAVSCLRCLCGGRKKGSWRLETDEVGYDDTALRLGGRKWREDSMNT